PFSLGWERTMGATGDLLNWELWCNGQILDGGDLALGPSSPNEWPSGHRYITHYAPRTDPQLTTNECEFQVRPGDAEAVTLGTVQVKGRERIFSLEHPPQNLMDIQVLDRARLIGFEVSGAAMQPGDTFTVTLYWEAQAPVDLDYTVFVHLASKADGQVYAQSDMVPQGGAAPTTSWVAGQIIQDTYTLTIPGTVEEGEYVLSVGLYDVGTGTRATLYGEDGAMLEGNMVLLAEIKVK
ncbi:MAG: hypothetical protein JW981_04050, partial [Anaerolineae bacterium]|nr:hypothetical protein [Anaerolineae bacterium]